MTTRCGIGYDAHRLVAGRKLILGGVEIPHAVGLDGHSDADVLCHAIADALLGAIGESDIGHHFPNTDEGIRGISSIAILERVSEVVAQKQGRVVNVDATLIAEAPKIAPHIAAMRARLAEVLGIDVGQVNVKAKTAEQMGPVGEGRAIEARAVCLLVGRG